MDRLLRLQHFLILPLVAFASISARAAAMDGDGVPCGLAALREVSASLRTSQLPIGTFPGGMLDVEMRRIGRIQEPGVGERLTLHINGEAQSQVYTVTSLRNRGVVLRSPQGREVALTHTEYLMLLGEQFPARGRPIDRYERWNYIADHVLEHERDVSIDRRRGPRYSPEFIQARDRILRSNVQARTQLAQGRGTFSRITSADNARYESLTVGVAENRNRVVFAAEMPILKEVNDVFFGDPAMATSAANLFNNLIMDEIESGPLRALLRASTTGRYYDYKGIRFSFEATPSMSARQIEAALELAYRSARQRFAVEMRRIGFGPLTEFPGLGFAGNFENWFLAGIGSTNDEASLAARFARDRSDLNPIPLLTMRNEAPRVGQRMQQAEAERRTLQRAFGPENRSGGLLEAVEGHPNILVPSEGAVEIFRKAGRDSADGRARIRARFGIDITEEQYDSLNQYLTSVDRFAPSLVIRERVDLGISSATDGVSVDFAGVGARNLHRVSQDLALSFVQNGANSRLLGANLNRIREGERAITRQLDRQRAQVRRIFDVTILTNTHRRPGARNQARRVFDMTAGPNARPLSGPQLRFTGDDGFAQIDGPLEDAQVQTLVRRLAGMDDPVFPVSGLRMTGTPRGNFGTTMETAQVIKRNEDFLKRYSKELEAAFSGQPEVRRGLSRSVILSEPLAQANGGVGFRLTAATRLDAATQQRMREIAAQIASESGVEATMDFFTPIRELSVPR